MKTFRMLSVLLAGLLVAAVALAQQQQMSHKQQTAPQGAASGAMNGNMMNQCASVTEMRQKMMSDMKAADAELEKLAAEMNTATQDKKLDAMAAVINKLVEQRRAMNEMMPEMQMKTMQHMMGHMQAGKDSMSMCPMQQQMKDSAGAAGGPKDQHAAHHQ